jgi:hypothetical protein
VSYELSSINHWIVGSADVTIDALTNEGKIEPELDCTAFLLPYRFRFLRLAAGAFIPPMPRGGLRLLRRSIQNMNANAAAKMQNATTSATTIS